MFASRNGYIDCLKLLIDNGGDINVRTNVSDRIGMVLSVTHLKLYVSDISFEVLLFPIF